jgi:hypothetical protein
MKFDRVINGIHVYLNNEIYPNMNDWQEILARLAISRIMGDTNKLKGILKDNAFVSTFAIIDSDDNVDIDGIMTDLRRMIEEKGKFTINIPMFGEFTFMPEDVDKLHRTIQGAY